MPEMIVAKPFTLTMPGQEPRFFGVGIHKDVPDDVANHWFSRAHIAKDGKLPEPAPTAPLTNEERASVKAHLDMLEARALDAENRASAAEGHVARLGKMLLEEGNNSSELQQKCDAAEERARKGDEAEARYKSATEATDAISAENAALKARITSLEADLDKATKPAASTTAKPAGK